MGLREKAKKYRNRTDIIMSDNKEHGKDSIRQQAIQLFLKSDNYIREDEYNIYSLNDELTISSKNKSIQIVIIVVLFLFIVLLSTKIISEYIDKKSRDIVVNIAEFSDLNIQEILEAAKKSKEELDKVKGELNYLKDNMDKEIDKIKKEFEEKQKKIAVSRGISKEEREKLLEKIREEQERALKNATSKYSKEIEEREKYLKNVENKIKETEIKLEQERKRTEAKLKEVEFESAKRLDATRSLYEIKIKEQKEEFNKQKENYEKEIRKFKADIEEQKKEFEKITNQIKTYQNNLDILKSDYSKLLEENNNLKKEFEKLNKKVNIYTMYLNNFIKQIEILMITENVNGYVFMTNGNSCYVVLNRLYEIKDGLEASIFNKKGKLAAKIRFKNVEKYNELRIFEAEIVKKYLEIYPTYLIIIEGL